MPDLIYNVKFNIEDNLQQGVAGAERYQQEIEELNAEVAELRGQISSTANAQKQLGNQNVKTSNSMRSMNKQTAIGNQLFFSMSDGIQDSAQFSQGFSTGMRAIGNNIGFTAELAGSFVQRTKEMGDGTFTFSNAAKGLSASFLGVGGVILAINTAVTLLTVFSKKTNEAKKEIDEFGKTAVNVSEDLSQTFFGERSALLTGGLVAGLAIEFGDLDESLEEAGDSSNKFSRGLVRFVNNMRLFGDETKSNTDILNLFNEETVESTELTDEAIEAKAALITKSAEELGLTEKQAEAVLKEVAAKQESLELERSLEKAFAASVDGGQEFLDIQSQIESITQDLALAEAERVIGLDELTITEESARQQLESLADVISNSMMDDAIKTQLILQLAKAFDSLAESAENAVPSQQEVLEGIRAFRDAARQALENPPEMIFGVDREEAPFIKRAQKRQAFLEKMQLESAKRSGDQRLVIQQQFERQRQRLIDQNIFDEETRASLQADRDQKLKDLRIKNQTEITQSIAQSAGALASVFGASKEIQVAMAVIDSGAAIVKTFSQLGFPAGIPAALAVAAQTAATIKQMQQVQPGSAQPIGAGGTSGASTPSFGFQSTEVTGGPRFMMPNYTPGSADGMLTPNVRVDIKADRKQLYAIVKKGEEEYRSIKA